MKNLSNQTSVHVKHLRRAFELASFASKSGNLPFGALLTIDHKIVLESENTVFSDHDATKHAEMNFLSVAAQNYTPSQLRSATVYCSTEPCTMCSGAL